MQVQISLEVLHNQFMRLCWCFLRLKKKKVQTSLEVQMIAKKNREKKNKRKKEGAHLLTSKS